MSDQKTMAKSWSIRSTWNYLIHTRSGQYFLIALGATVATGVGLLYVISNSYQPDIAQSTITSTYQPPVYSPLTGVELDDENLANRPVTAVMIENSTDARPQSGLKQAGLVYEAIAEGGISRFVAMYQEDKPSTIGPVRSLRPYYVEWLAAYDPAVAHVGGSKRSLDMIRSGRYGVDLDQFFNASTYRRANDRYAPHNVYTSTKSLDKLIRSKKKSTSQFTPLVRQDTPQDLPKPTAKSIKMNISSGDFAVSYSYDSKTNSYLRKQGGQTHRDREKGALKPDVVIAIMVSQHAVNEDGYRESIKTTGSGTAYVFQNGSAVKGKWHKKSPTSQITFTSSDGDAVELNRGQTWITAVPSGRTVSWQ